MSFIEINAEFDPGEIEQIIRRTEIRTVIDILQTIRLRYSDVNIFRNDPTTKEICVRYRIDPRMISGI